MQSISAFLDMTKIADFRGKGPKKAHPDQGQLDCGFGQIYFTENVSFCAVSNTNVGKIFYLFTTELEVNLQVVYNVGFEILTSSPCHKVPMVATKPNKRLFSFQ